MKKSIQDTVVISRGELDGNMCRGANPLNECWMVGIRAYKHEARV
jgi:hypothetical protein